MFTMNDRVVRVAVPHSHGGLPVGRLGTVVAADDRRVRVTWDADAGNGAVYEYRQDDDRISL